jgi:hypothetical protein
MEVPLGMGARPRGQGLTLPQDPALDDLYLLAVHQAPQRIENGERRLCRAMLADALKLIRDYRIWRGRAWIDRRHREWVVEFYLACEWLFLPSSVPYRYDFQNICDFLDLEPDYIRRLCQLELGMADIHPFLRRIKAWIIHTAFRMPERIADVVWVPQCEMWSAGRIGVRQYFACQIEAVSYAEGEARMVCAARYTESEREQRRA